MFALFKKGATKKNSWHYSAELKAIFFFAVSIFLATALFSYNAHDQSWFFYSTPSTACNNWCGYVGACLSSLLFFFFGTASLLWICLSIFLIFYYLQKKTIYKEGERIGAYICLPFIGSALLAVHSIDFFGNKIPGGCIGLALSSQLITWFDPLGSLIILYALFIGAIIIIGRLSLFRLVYLLLYVPVYLVRRGNYLQSIQKLYHYFKYIVKQSSATIIYWYKRILGNVSEYEVFDTQEVAQQEHVTDLFDTSTPEVETIKANDIPAWGGVCGEYKLPPLDIFVVQDDEYNDTTLNQELEKRAGLLQEKLERFGIYGKISAIKRGPLVTLFEYQPHIDTKISKIIALEDDLSLALQATSIRIIAPIPGRSVVGFEVANKIRKNVFLSTLIKTEPYKITTAALPMILGVDTTGTTVVADLSKMPHLLIAGSTGSGKSVALNAMLISLLVKLSPDDLQLILIDPKRLEFAAFSDIPHLLFPIVNDTKMAPAILRWVVQQMEARYEKMSLAGARNIYDYRQNALNTNQEKMPFIVVVIDELADLMITAGKEIEEAIIRISQMARAAGIHLITATQRPSVDVITGLIKVNFPSRISFRVSSKIDSRTILDCSGADKLLGRGDMLFFDAQDSTLKRVHGAYVLDKEINQVIAHIKSQRLPQYHDINQLYYADKKNITSQEDVLWHDVCNYLKEIDEVSISLLQRKFRIGYNRAARIIEMLEAQGHIMPSFGGKTRKIIR